MSASTGVRRLYDFPIYDISPLTGLSPHRDVVTRRLQALYAISTEEQPVVVTSVEAILLRVLPKEAMVRATDLLEVGEEIEREALLKRLQSNGYLRTSLVEERGDYSVRGGVVDIFPPRHSSPVRLEFWGERIESIRHFDVLSQRSKDHMKELVLLPASEIIHEKENVERARSMGRLPGPIGETGFFPGQEAWLHHFYPCLDTLFNYFPEEGLLFLVDPLQIQKEAKKFSEKFSRDAEKFEKEARERERPYPEIEGIPVDHETLPSIFDSYQCIEWRELAFEKESDASRTLQITGPSEVTGAFEIRLAGKGRVSMAPLAERISQWLAEGARVVLICRTEQQALRLKEILNNYQVHVNHVVNRWDDVPPGKGLSICLGRLSKGFSWIELGLHVVSEDEIFGPKRSLSRSRAGVGEGTASLTSFSLLKIGDMVVHEDHGIGRYGGLIKMEIEKKVNDFVLIQYENNDRLYTPADRISILQKYIGADEDNPKLDQLGGRSWDLAKRKAKRSIERIAKQLVEIYALRKHRKGFSFSRPDNYYREFEATFEHEETADQSRTINEVLSDMESEQPMDRLVCGDVGFGKTEVAVRAAFKAVADGKQVALLVPTTVLAEQHYETFKSRMDPYHIRVGVLSRFKTPKEQKHIIAQVRSGKIDVLIGTHRMFQKDVNYRELGLLIIDEEQRFGVKQKEALKKYRALVDVLALTATPIPRTFHLSLLGIRDLSVIETPPEDRTAIQTHLSPYDEPTIIHAIQFELERGGQVFFVHNRVQSINRMADRLMQLVPTARYAIAHGQMKEKDLEETMIRFLKKDIDVLVCTTIIESGLDIPSANTIIINQADRFGLAQIYQLRGRVGRSDEIAYAYLMLSKDADITRDAEKRLRALMDFSHLGAGIQLAMHDLKIRGGGNILGFSQSGHISAIGYELYLKMIEQSIAGLKGEEWREEINPEINIPVSAYLPGNYISDTDVRLNTYRRLSSLREETELREVIDEMNDRFGPPPAEVSNLFEVMSIRLLMKKIGVNRLDAADEGLALTFALTTELDPETLIKMVGGAPENYQFLSAQKLIVKNRQGLSEDYLKGAKEILDRFCDVKGYSSMRSG
ncbi:MAG: transcription-repair coupling factor [Deltaproteobacteria bacterium]|nr:transcription-repair coupling factor [Deltaproteobacteria bacterium]